MTMDFLTGVFVVGTFWFWALLAAEMVLLLYCIEQEFSGWATISILGVLGLMQLSGVPVFNWCVNNPEIIIVGLLAHLLAGTIWATTKWWFFVKDQRRKYDQFKQRWLKLHRVEGPVVPPEMRDKFKRDLTWENFEVYPKIVNHKGQIYLWMIYWQWSLCWTMIDDPIRRAFSQIYEAIKNKLQGISDRIWAGTEEDVTVPPPIILQKDAVDRDNGGMHR